MDTKPVSTDESPLVKLDNNLQPTQGRSLASATFTLIQQWARDVFVETIDS